MEFLVVKVKQAMNVGVCSVYLDDAKRERYLLMASDGLNRASVGRSYLEYGQGLIGWVADRSEILNTDNAPAHPNYQYLHETARSVITPFWVSPFCTSVACWGFWWSSKSSPGPLMMPRSLC